MSSTESGSFGIIEDINSQRVKLYFKTESIREQIVKTTENPFNLFFLVDVDVSRTELSDKPVLYNIIQVHGEPWSIT